jgi:hypothetical protein
MTASLTSAGAWEARIFGEADELLIAQLDQELRR